MATSGTNVFENTFFIDEIFEEAYERVGLKEITGYHLTSGRRSLNIMFQEWANRGLHYWEIGETNIDLIEGQAEYTFFRSSGDGTSSSTNATSNVFGVADILEANLNSGSLIINIKNPINGSVSGAPSAMITISELISTIDDQALTIDTGPMSGQMDPISVDLDNYKLILPQADQNLYYVADVQTAYEVGTYSCLLYTSPSPRD